MLKRPFMEYKRSKVACILNLASCWHARRHKICYALVLSIILFANLAVALDILFARQIFGFLFLWILPGMLILNILLPKETIGETIGLAEKFLLAAGLSCASVMFSGLAINSLYPLVSSNPPLSTYPVMIALNALMLLLIAICYLNDRNPLFFSLNDLNSSSFEKLFLVFPATFALMSILGTQLMNYRGINHLLMALLFSIAAYVLLISLIHRRVPDRVYPAMIFLMSVSIVLILALRSNHIIGSDAHSEYYLFMRAIEDGLWHITPIGGNTLNGDNVLGLLDSCLSISILPAVYQLCLNINPEYLFKVNNALIFSVSPLAIYILSKKYLDSFHSFLASFFFMSQLVFFMTAYNPRTVIAVLFFSLSILMIFEDSIRGPAKRVLFLIFAGSCILSHYTTSYLFFFVLVLGWSLMQSGPRILAWLKRTNLFPEAGNLCPGHPVPPPGLHPGPPYVRVFVNYRIILIFFAMMFLWHCQITGEPFRYAVDFFSTIVKDLSQLLLVESRGDGIALAFGVGMDPRQIPLLISFTSSWLTVCFLSLGLLCAATSCAGSYLNLNWLNKPGRIFSRELNPEFLAIAIVCYAIILISVILPYVAKGYGMDRIYFQMSVILSPFFIIGGRIIAEKIHIKSSFLVILAVLIPYFLCNSGAMHQAFGVEKMITLTSGGKMYDELYITDHETYSAKWLEARAENGMNIYADFYGTNRLTSQGKIPSAVYMKGLLEEGSQPREGYIYLRYCGAVTGKLLDRKGKWHDINDYKGYFGRINLIYSNGGSEILE
jgi:uncharacterized membrane protein